MTLRRWTSDSSRHDLVVWKDEVDCKYTNHDGRGHCDIRDDSLMSLAMQSGFEINKIRKPYWFGRVCIDFSTRHQRPNLMRSYICYKYACVRWIDSGLGIMFWQSSHVDSSKYFQAVIAYSVNIDTRQSFILLCCIIHVCHHHIQIIRHIEGSFWFYVRW